MKKSYVIDYYQEMHRIGEFDRVVISPRPGTLYTRGEQVPYLIEELAKMHPHTEFILAYDAGYSATAWAYYSNKVRSRIMHEAGMLQRVSASNFIGILYSAVPVINGKSLNDPKYARQVYRRRKWDVAKVYDACSKHKGSSLCNANSEVCKDSLYTFADTLRDILHDPFTRPIYIELSKFTPTWNIPINFGVKCTVKDIGSKGMDQALNYSFTRDVLAYVDFNSAGSYNYIDSCSEVRRVERLSMLSMFDVNGIKWVRSGLNAHHIQREIINMRGGIK